MNQYFAHNGVDHHSTTEAAVHSASSSTSGVILTVVLVTVVVGVLMGLAVWAVKRVSANPAKPKKED